MNKTLYIDATVRDESRTKILSDYLVEKIGGEVKYLPLSFVKLPELNGPMLEFRNKCCDNRNFESPLFDFAKAECLYYVTTAGGYLGEGTFGYEYLRFLCKGMFGIEHTHMFKAEGLDIYGADVPSILEQTKKEIDKFFIERIS